MTQAQNIKQSVRPSVTLTADPVKVDMFGKTELRVFLSDDGTEYQVWISRKASGKQPLLVSHSKLALTQRLRRNKDGSATKRQRPQVLETRTPEQAIAKALAGARNEIKGWKPAKKMADPNQLQMAI